MALIVCGLASASSADAVPVTASPPALPIASAPYLTEGEPDLAPLPHVLFCIENAVECAGTNAFGTTLGDEVMNLLSRVNREVNRRIQPRLKPATLARWEISPEAGDCNDYAVTKRHELISAGLPASALRLAVVRTAWGDGHLILVVKTKQGDLILDNLTEALRPWNRTGYWFLKVQTARDGRNWASVDVPVSYTQVRRRSVPVAFNNHDWFRGSSP